MENWKKSSLTIIGFLILLTSALEAQPSKRMQSVMGTTLQVNVKSTTPEAQEEALEKVFKEVRYYDQLLSNYDENSELSRINREAYPESTQTSSHMIHFLKEAKELSQETSGYYDITIEALTQLWNLRERTLEKKPSKKKVEKIRYLVGHNRLEIYSYDYTVRFLIEGLGLDSGGIGKGYAMDRALEKVVYQDLQSIAFNFGGELLYWSRDSNQKSVAIRNPKNPDRVWETYSILLEPEQPMAISTSGNYERNVTLKKGKDTEILGHLINPKTGYPTNHEIKSVTVLDNSAAKADAWSTALFVMGLEKASIMMSEKKIAGLILYEKNGDLHSTHSLEWKQRTKLEN